jgi:hypothetical protein
MTRVVLASVVFIDGWWSAGKQRKGEEVRLSGAERGGAARFSAVDPASRGIALVNGSWNGEMTVTRSTTIEAL